MNEVIRKKLLAIASEQDEARIAVVTSGDLQGEESEALEKILERTANDLQALIESFGWPGVGLAGEDGAAAAWSVLQHSVGNPALLRMALPLIQQAARDGEIPPDQAAFLEDRICFFERRPQKYGTQFDWNDEGKLAPWPIADESIVNQLRAELGMNTIEEQAKAREARIVGTGMQPPKDPAVRREMMTDWAREIGWIE